MEIIKLIRTGKLAESPYTNEIDYQIFKSIKNLQNCNKSNALEITKEAFNFRSSVGITRTSQYMRTLRTLKAFCRDGFISWDAKKNQHNKRYYKILKEPYFTKLEYIERKEIIE